MNPAIRSLLLCYYLTLLTSYALGAAIRLTTIEEYDNLVKHSGKNGILLFANSDTIYGINKHGPEFDALSDDLAENSNFYVGIIDCFKNGDVCRSAKVISNLVIAAMKNGKPNYLKTRTDNMNVDSYKEWIMELGLLEEKDEL